MGIDWQQQKQLWKQAFGDTDGFISDFFSTGFSESRAEFLWEGDTLAAMVYWLDGVYGSQKLAYLYGVATAETFRGRGLCRKLMEKTHQRLKAQGYAGALLHPADEGLRKMYASFGYRSGTFGRTIACQAKEPVPLRPVAREEFSQLRRQYLPADGVIQEGESLAFLQTLGQCYAGEDFLLTARKEGDTLVGLELLGNEKAAAGILGALGCQRGTFRVPGGDEERTLFLPLKKDAEKPGYFGFLFD